ncbi:MAG: DUF2232 domain-containing protein [Firmicutes bacterium]|nr:DUF2232 domain-containing protein [Bacillota bacterium]
MSGMDGKRPPHGPGGSVDGAVLAAAAVLMAVLGAVSPLPLWGLSPAPLAALVYRHGYRAGIVSAAFVVIVAGALQGPLLAELEPILPSGTERPALLSAMAVPVTVGLLGLVIGGAWREGVAAGPTFWLGLGAALFPGAALWTLVRVIERVDLVGLVIDVWVALLETAADQAAGGPLAPEAARSLQEAAASWKQAFAEARPLFPGMMASYAVPWAFVNMAIARWLLQRLGEAPPWFPPFSRWRFPWPVALGFVAGQGLLLGAAITGSRLMEIAGGNLNVFFSVLFTVQGLAVGWHWLKRRRVPPLLGAVMLGIVWFALPNVPPWAGVLDTWFNFRRLPTSDEAADGGRIEG